MHVPYPWTMCQGLLIHDTELKSAIIMTWVWKTTHVQQETSKKVTRKSDYIVFVDARPQEGHHLMLIMLLVSLLDATYFCQSKQNSKPTGSMVISVTVNLMSGQSVRGSRDNL